MLKRDLRLVLRQQAWCAGLALLLNMLPVTATISAWLIPVTLGGMLFRDALGVNVREVQRLVPAGIGLPLLAVAVNGYRATADWWPVALALLCGSVFGVLEWRWAARRGPTVSLMSPVANRAQ